MSRAADHLRDFLMSRQGLSKALGEAVSKPLSQRPSKGGAQAASKRLASPVGEVIAIRITGAQGSSPRREGAVLYLRDDGAIHGTVGGGRLEWMALERAREMLKDGTARDEMDVPLGPDIGQCCGGRVQLTLERMDDAAKARACEEARRAEARLPEVLVFGAGHVGRALAAGFALLPVRLRLIDSRAEELDRAPDVEKVLTAIPEAEVARAGPGAAFLAMTHEHASDFEVTKAALARGDAAYVGMIGSKTKRANLVRQCRAEGIDTAMLTCPIGAPSRDNRPQVIAALTVAEVMRAFEAAQEGVPADNTTLASLQL